MNVRLYLLAVLAALAAFACQKPQKPVLSIDRMTEVLTEIHLAITGSEVVWKEPAEREARRPALQEAVLAKHGLSRALFYESYTYYVERPKLMDSLYSRVIARLDSLQPNEQAREKARQEGNRLPVWIGQPGEAPPAANKPRP